MSFTTVDAPIPRVEPAEAHALLTHHWGLHGRLSELGSQQDRNIRVDADGHRYVLKVSNPGLARTTLEAQHAAIRTLRDRLPALALPAPVPSLTGAEIVAATLASGRYDVRLLRFVDGDLLDAVHHLAPVTLEAVGRLLGEVTTALSDLDHPGAAHRSQWDLRLTPELLASLAPRLDPALRDTLTGAVDGVADRLVRLVDDLPQQICHADAHDGNIVVHRGEDGRVVPHGLIDFGDLVWTWRLADLAIATAAIVRRAPHDPLPIAAALARGFTSTRPLDDAEVAALWPAVVWRAAGDTCATAYGCLVEPDNPYTAAAIGPLREVLDALVAVPIDLAEETLRAALDAPPGGAGAALRAVVGRLAQRDRRDHSSNAGAAAAAVRIRHGEVLPAVEASAEEPATRHLGVGLTGRHGATVHAPLDALVHRCGPDGLVLAADGVEIVLDGVSPAVSAGQSAPRGAVLGTLRDTRDTDAAAGTGAGADDTDHAGSTADRVGTGHLRVAVTVPGLDPPTAVTPTAWPGWSRVCSDPTACLDLTLLLGTDGAVDEADSTAHDVAGEEAGNVVPSDAAAALARRRSLVLGRAQELYYRTPPWIVSGRGAVLRDVEGRSYLDMINNVTVLGHAHPAVTEAVRAQLDRLNTNSRFHYEPLVAFAERLASRLPDGLDQVFVVTSGSEATELALRLARHATGRRDVLYLDDGYHGWTAAAASVSGELAEVRSPLLPGSDLTHPLLAPNRYRGPYRGPDATDRYVASATAVIDQLVADGRPPAALIAETLLGNAGGIALPPGYLDRVYAEVRRAGGVCIADEVQVGYGRLGTHFWGFETQQVVPDVVTVAKAAGNGIPIGAVVTRREIADAYAQSAYFFSSAGGSPVSCAAGIAVLDTIEREGLQARALEVGGRLQRRLETLRTSLDDGAVGTGAVRIGAVHGQGLYLGVELVRDVDTREPAGPETQALCERMLELGVIVQPTSRFGNVLKVKPPLCLDDDQADAFVDRLGTALTEGW